ncbi:MAG: molybdopterin cofactor-binding domain-containing protein [Bryobacteraceae bacterium]
MKEIRKINRRGFLGGVFSAGALILGARVIPRASAAQDAMPASTWMPNVFVGLNPDGSVILLAHRSEMGTGIRTSLPMVIADEMEADWSRVHVRQAPGDEAKYGSQDTDGSQSIRDFYGIMREMGASARLMLERGAATKWNVPASECKAQFHDVIHEPSGRKIGFGELVSIASTQPTPKKNEIRLKDVSQFRYIGKGVPSVDLEGILTGKAEFGMDAKRPGMVYASIYRSPVLGGKLKSYDDKEARAVPGVEQTLVIDPFKPPAGFQALGGVAVVAGNTWAAMQGRKKLKVEWEFGPNAIYQSETYKQELIAASRKPQKVVRNVGDVDTAFQKASKIIEAQYYTPLLAHASMEPPVAVAEYRDGKVETWSPTQNPDGVQETVAAALGIGKKDVTAHVTLLGGAFGRKSKPDYVAEAAILSKRVGKPVKVVWSREEDLSFDYYHSTAAMYMKAALDGSGKPVAWLQRTVFPPINSTFKAGETYGDKGELSMGWTNVPFDLPNHRAENGPAQAHVRIGWLRSVANVYHAYAVQSFIDELAHEAGRDSVEYWLEVLGPERRLEDVNDNAKFPFEINRLRRVAQVAAEKSGWANKKSGQRRAMGFAAHRSFYTYVAAVVEVDIDSTGRLRIPRVDLAVDAGRIINPDRVIAQFEGAATFGVSVAVLGEITAADGRIQQTNFNNYPVARIDEAPLETHVHLIGMDENPPTGVGEPGVPPMAPAICNAVFAATGKRIRELPIRKQKLV